MPDTPRPPSPLGDVEVHDLWSTEVDDTFRIFVGHCGDEPEALLVVTDANGQFGMAVDTVRMMQLPALLPPMLVVGIGYPSAATIGDTVGIRARDLTPTNSEHFEGSGGADAFLRFIRTELFPWVGNISPSSLNHTVYFGHSLGGLFGVHALLAEPPAFDDFIISSPSLWWDHHVMLGHEAAYAESHDDLPANVSFGIGSEETDEGRRAEGSNLPDGHPMKPRRTYLDMVDDLARLTELLRSRAYPNLHLNDAVYPDEYHATVAPIVLSHGLRRAFASA